MSTPTDAPKRQRKSASKPTETTTTPAPVVVQETVVESSKHHRRRKLKSALPKDDTHPKRPTSAYILYCMSEREAYKNSHPGVSQTDISKALGDCWKALTDKKKAKFQKAYADDRARYEKEMASYTPRDGTREGALRMKREAPKRALPAYQFYRRDQHAEIKARNPDATFGDIQRLASASWKLLSEAERRRYEEQSRLDHERFSRETANVRQATPEQPACTGGVCELPSSSKKTRRSRTAETAPAPVVVKVEETAPQTTSTAPRRKRTAVQAVQEMLTA